jgi:hypothetical protein
MMASGSRRAATFFSRYFRAMPWTFMFEGRPGCELHELVVEQRHAALH